MIYYIAPLDLNHANRALFFITELYLKDVTSDATAKEGKPSILKETICTALVDGNNLLGRKSSLPFSFGHFTYALI